MRIIYGKLIVITCNCLVTSYLFFTIGNLVIFNNLSLKKVFLFCSKLARNGGTAQLAWRKGTPFCKNVMFKKDYFVVFRLNKVVLGDLTTFWKKCRGVPFYNGFSCSRNLNPFPFRCGLSFKNYIWLKWMTLYLHWENLVFPLWSNWLPVRLSRYCVEFWGPWSFCCQDSWSYHRNPSKELKVAIKFMNHISI